MNRQAMVFRLLFSHTTLEIQHVKRIECLKPQGSQEPACSRPPASPRDPQSVV